MIALFRAGILAFVILTVVYLLVSIYSRSMRREKLEKEWDTDPAREGAAKDERATYIEAGMQAYRHSLRRRLILLVYIIPMVVFLATVYVINAQ